MDKTALNQPVFFERNRVARVYRGGKLFHNFFGDAPVDENLPEEWVCSPVAALNDGGKPTDGLSTVRGTDVFFRDLLTAYPDEMLGSRKSLGVLVKILDSAERLPVQAHPDKAFAKKHFNSEFGKTEMWLVLATRPDANVYIGFERGIGKSEFLAAVDASQTDRTAMEKLLHRQSVQAGDVYLIPAGMPHAIGAGCLILEVQEPTDFTVQPEAWCGSHRLSEYQKYLGLHPDTAVDCFDFSMTYDKALTISKRTPKSICSENNCNVESLISYGDTPCFAVNRLTLSDCPGFTLPRKPAVFIVTEGRGAVTTTDKVVPLSTGDYFFLPHGASDCTIFGSLTLIECLPPRL